MALQVAVKPNTSLSAATYLPYSLSSLLQLVHTIATLTTPPSQPRLPTTQQTTTKIDIQMRFCCCCSCSCCCCYYWWWWWRMKRWGITDYGVIKATGCGTDDRGAYQSLIRVSGHISGTGPHRILKGLNTHTHTHARTPH